MRPSTRVILTAVFATACVAASSTAADADDGKDVRAVASKSNHSYGRSGGHHTPPSRGDRGDHYDRHDGRHDGRHHPGGHGYRDDHGYRGHHGRDYAHHGYRRHYGHRDWGHSYSRHYYRPPYSRHYAPYPKHRGYYCERCHYHASSYTIFYQHLFNHHHVPWYDIGALIVFDPVRLYFVFGGHG